MRRTIALLLTAVLVTFAAVSVAASPPTKEKSQKVEYSKIIKSDTADTSAVAASDAEARTCEAAHGAAGYVLRL